jgi:hypothetical protein
MEAAIRTAKLSKCYRKITGIEDYIRLGLSQLGLRGR